MGGSEFVRSVRWDLHALFRWQRLILFTAVFACIALWNVYRVSPQGSAWDVILLTFGGFVQASLVDGMAWFLIQLLPIYYVGLFVSEAVTDHSVLLLLRIRSRARWWLAKVVTVLIGIHAYFAWGFLVVIGLAYAFLPVGTGPVELADWWPVGMNGPSLLFWMYLLQTGTAAAMATVMLMLSLIWPRVQVPFLLVSLTNLVSLFAAAKLPQLYRFVPGTQSMLGLHQETAVGTPGFTLGWSLAYNAVLWAASFWLGRTLFSVKDIAGAGD